MHNDAGDDCAALTRVVAWCMVQEIIVHLFSNNGQSDLCECASSCVCVCVSRGSGAGG